MALLSVSGISKEDDTSFSIRDIHFRQEPRQHLAIVGETGSGKSTLLKIIAGLEQADGGEVVFEGERVEGPREKLIPGHPGIVYLSQHFELPKSLRVEQVLRYANHLSREAADKLYSFCQIDHLLGRNTSHLSGGERQRIALAKLLITSPRLLLMDEPFSHLDLIHKNTLKKIVRDISEELDITSILVSHDPADVLPWADEILVMQQGKLVQQGAPDLLYYEPADEYVAGLLGNYNLLPAALVTELSLSQTAPPGKNLFVRPEAIEVVKSVDPKGVVTGVNFLGGHYEVIVDVMGHTLVVHTPDATLRTGDDVRVTLSNKNKIHYLA